MISPGVIIHPVSEVNASIPGANEVILEADYQFSDPYSGLSGSLSIRESGGIQMNQMGAGFGLANSPLFVAQAMPNFALSIPELGNDYYIGHGNYQEGEVLDYDSIVANSALLSFPSSGGTMSVTLQANGTFSVQ